MKFSELESKRFGLRIFRQIFTEDLNEISSQKIVDQMTENEADMLIFRFPVQKQFQLHFLQKSNLPIIFADTLVYYQTVLTENILPLKNQDLSFEICEKDKLSVLESLNDQIFDAYTTHYFSNPIFKRKDILAGYQEWALAYAKTENSGKVAFLIKKGQIYVGFITLSLENQTVEGILNGILPEFQNQGIYTDTLRFVKKRYFEMGFQAMKISTQIQNYAVQKAWTKEGFHLNQAWVTLHIHRK